MYEGMGAEAFRLGMMYAQADPKLWGEVLTELAREEATEDQLAGWTQQAEQVSANVRRFWEGRADTPGGEPDSDDPAG